MYINKDNTAALKTISNQSTPYETLLALLVEFHGDIAIAEAVASHPNCSKELLGRMHYFQLEAVKENPNFLEFSKDTAWLDEYHVDLSNKDLAQSKYGYIGWEKTYQPVKPQLCTINTQIFKAQCLVRHSRPSRRADILNNYVNLPESLFQELAKEKDAKTRVLVAKSKNIPKSTAIQLASDKLKSVRKSLANNKKAHSEALAILANDKLDDIKSAAFANPNCPREVTKQKRVEKKAKKALSSEKIVELPYKEKVELLLDANTSIEVLEKFATDELPIIRYLVGYHNNINDALAEIILKDPVEWVQESVAYNSASNPELLSRLITQNKLHFNKALSCNSAVLEADQIKLLNNFETRKALLILNIANTTTSKNVLQAIADKWPEKIARTHWVTKLRDALAEKAKGKTLKQMLRLTDYRYRWLSRLLVSRDDCPEDMLEYFNFYCPEELRLNNAVSLRLLESPGSLNKYSYQGWKVQKWLSQRYAPAFVTHYFLKKDFVKEKRQAAGGEFACIADFQTLVFDPDTMVRKRLAERPDLPKFMFYALARDKKENVSKAVVNNKACPKSIISNLSESKNTAVSMAARNSAKKRGVKVAESAEKMDLKGLRKKERLQVAASTRSAKKQELLANDRLADVKIELLKNTQLSEGVFNLLIADPDAKVRTAIAAHRIMGPTNFEQLSTDPDPGVRTALVKNIPMSLLTTSQLPKDVDDEVRLACAKKILRITDRIVESKGQEWFDNYLMQVLSDTDTAIRTFLAKEKLHILNEQHQLLLCSDDAQEIRSHLAQRSKVVSVVLKLLDDPEEEVRKVATHSNLWRNYLGEFNTYNPLLLDAIKHSKDPFKERFYAIHGGGIDRLEELLKDENTCIAAMANANFSIEHEKIVLTKKDNQNIMDTLARYTKSRETFDSMLEKLSEDFKPSSGFFTAKTNSVFDNKLHWPDTDFQEKFCQHKNPKVREKITRQSNLMQTTAMQLAKDPDKSIRRCLSERCKYPDVLKAMLNDEDPRVLRHIFVNEVCDDEMQRIIYSRYKGSDYKSEKIDNVLFQALSIAPIVVDEKNKLLDKIMEKTTLPEIYLELINDHFKSVEYTFYENETMLDHPEVQKMILDHPSSDVRYVLARRDNLPDEYRKILLKDKDKEVRKAAKQQY